MYIDSIFTVIGIGIVLAGTVKFNKIVLGQKLYLGPISNTYISVTVKSLHNCISENVDVLHENDSGSIGIRLDTKGSYSRELFRKGQIVTNDLAFAMKNTSFTINCLVAVFNHPTTIKNGYQTVVHCNTIRQTAKFKMADDMLLRTNSKENITIKFLRRAEFIMPNTLFMFRDGRTKGMGKVISTIPFTEDSLDPIIKVRKNSIRRSEKRKLKKILAKGKI